MACKYNKVSNEQHNRSLDTLFFVMPVKIPPCALKLRER